jgi:NADPH:quinone reductase
LNQFTSINPQNAWNTNQRIRQGTSLFLSPRQSPAFTQPTNPSPTQGPSDLTVTDLPDPQPSKDQYLIAIHASATNFFDLLQIRGKYQHQPPLPWVSGSEFAGVVLSVPSSLSSPKFQVGDRVFGASQGGYATKVAAREETLRPVPKGWSFFEAAGLFVTAPTSYGALVTRAGVKAGDYVLVHAAAGGVGLAAVQIAKAFGATVIATAGTKHKLDVAKSFGADYGVDYNNANWPDEVKKLTPKARGVDIVYDPVGLIDKSTKCTRWNGRLLVIGFAAGNIEKVAMNKVLLKNISIVGLHWGAYAINEPEKIGEVWEGIFKLIAEGKFRGTVFTDMEFVGLESVGEALKSLGSRGTWGKVVVKVPQEGESKL